MRLDYETYQELLEEFSWSEAWEYVDGTPGDVNATTECIARHPDDRIAISIASDDGRSERYTFGDLDRSTARFARYLEASGVGPGDAVAVMLDPSFEFATAFFGAMRRGAVAVPCSELFGPEALQYRVDAADPAVLVTSAAVAADVDTSGVGTVLRRDSLRDAIREYPDRYSAETTSEDRAWLQFTSGTTGTPTEVPFQHGSVVQFAPVMDFVLDFSPDDVCFTTSSTGWGTGIWIGLFAPLVVGVQTGFYSGKFDPERALAALEEFDVNTLIGVVPTAYRNLVDASDGTGPVVEKANYVGEPIDPGLSREVESTLGAFPRSTYGATEIRSIITVDYAFDDYEFRHGSMGKPLPGQAVTILDDEGNERPPGEVGTIAVKRTDEWILTSDAGYRDADGYFWSAGRVDDTIISAGYTIGPQEVEDSIRSHPEVVEVGVIGVPDEERGEVVKAFVEPAADPSTELADSIQSYVRKRLSKHEYPREVEFVDAIPTTPDGKIQRSLLREREGLS